MVSRLLESFPQERPPGTPERLGRIKGRVFGRIEFVLRTTLMRMPPDTSIRLNFTPYSLNPNTLNPTSYKFPKGHECPPTSSGGQTLLNLEVSFNSPHPHSGLGCRVQGLHLHNKSCFLPRSPKATRTRRSAPTQLNLKP